LKVFYPNNTQTELASIFGRMYDPAVSLWQRTRHWPMIKIYTANPVGAS
jgi:hypothetical protein